MSKIAVYFMPGLAACPSIFERIDLPKDDFEMVFLEWQVPLNNEKLEDYAKRMTKFVKHENPVLVGVSFGGILVQEMSKFLKPKKVIIISSLKSSAEYPLKFKIAKTTKAYKLIPTNLLINIESLAKFSFGDKVKQRLKLYEKYLRVRDKKYLEWAIEQVILWEKLKADPNVIHIHGDADDVFPIKHIDNPIVIKDGTHIMILNKYKWFNENLPKLIRN